MISYGLLSPWDPWNCCACNLHELPVLPKLFASLWATHASDPTEPPWIGSRLEPAAVPEGLSLEIDEHQKLLQKSQLRTSKACFLMIWPRSDRFRFITFSKKWTYIKMLKNLFKMEAASTLPVLQRPWGKWMR